MDYIALSELLGNYGEFIGSIAVVVTLIYLIVQVRQTRNSIYGSVEMQTLALNIDWHARIAASTEMRAIYDKAVKNEPMTEDERSQWIWIAVQVIYTNEVHHLQYERKAISDEVWQKSMNSTLGYLQNEVIKEWWDNRVGNVSEPFREVVNQQLASGNRGSWQPKPAQEARQKTG